MFQRIPLGCQWGLPALAAYNIIATRNLWQDTWEDDTEWELTQKKYHGILYFIETVWVARVTFSIGLMGSIQNNPHCGNPSENMR